MALVLDGDNGIVGVLATNNDGDVIFDTNTLFVDAVENKVGIGTTSPGDKLHVYNTSGNTYAKLESDGNNTRSALLPYAKKSDGSIIKGFIGVVGDANKMEVATTTNDPIHFYTNNNPTNSGIFLNVDGNVGIGTTNPRATLDTGYTRVYNSGAASSPTDGKGLEIHYVTSNRAQGEGAYVISYDRDNSEYKQFTVDADSINLSTGGTTKVSVTNVGVIQGVSDAEIATSPIRTHSNTISTNTTIDANDNAVASGPLGIADGVTLTINGNMTVV